jgi:hypothetical protein
MAESADRQGLQGGVSTVSRRMGVRCSAGCGGGLNSCQVMRSSLLHNSHVAQRGKFLLMSLRGNVGHQSAQFDCFCRFHKCCETSFQALNGISAPASCSAAFSLKLKSSGSRSRGGSRQYHEELGFLQLLQLLAGIGLSAMLQGEITADN